jgi:hypothetical protein
MHGVPGTARGRCESQPRDRRPVGPIAHARLRDRRW